MCADRLLQLKKLAGFSAGILAEFGWNRFYMSARPSLIHSSILGLPRMLIASSMSLVDMCNDYK